MERKQRPNFLSHTGKQEQVAVRSFGLLFLERKQEPSHQVLLALCSAKNMCKTTWLITALIFSTYLDITVIIRVWCHIGVWGQSNYKVANSIFFFFSRMYLLGVPTFRKSKLLEIKTLAPSFLKSFNCYENSRISLSSIWVMCLKIPVLSRYQIHFKK